MTTERLKDVRRHDISSVITGYKRDARNRNLMPWERNLAVIRLQEAVGQRRSLNSAGK